MSLPTSKNYIPGVVLNSPYLETAVKRVSNIPTLINAVSQRVHQLNSGHRPLLRLEGEPSSMDIALAEIGQGLVDLLASGDSSAEGETAEKADS